jgi:uncharacterized protein YndB with AHSA1/START domain
MAEILHMVSVKGTPEKVYAALTEQSGLAGWWTEEVQAQPRVGSVARFKFGEAGGNEMMILALDKNRLVHWRCIANSFGEEWVNTEIFFELRRSGDKTTFASAIDAGCRSPTSCASAA